MRTLPDDDPIELVEITNEAMTAIRSAAFSHRPFRQTGTNLHNGNWSVPLQQSTIKRIKSRMMAGESLSDVIVRVVHTAGKPQQ